MNLPIRVRLTAWNALLLAVILVAFGAFLVLRLRSDLWATIDQEITRAIPYIGMGYHEGGAEDLLDESRTALPRAGAAVQVVDPGGHVLVAYGNAAGARPLAPAAARASALGGATRLLTVTRRPGARRYRMVVAPVSHKGRRRVLIVAQSLHEVDESVERVLLLVLLAGPAALAGTAFVGWWLARKALRPVERMTSHAEGIGIERLHERVPVPRAHDEIRHLATTLNAMLDRLELGVREKHRLVADASHELRTPLAVMRAELDVSLRADERSPTEREVLESLREEVDRLSRMAENLLVLAQADEGRLALLTSPVALRDAVEGAVRLLRPLGEAKGVGLVVKCDDGGREAEAEADPERLQQVLRNFLDNAIAFTPPGGAICVEAWAHGDEVGVTVIDDGPGIPAEARAHVFDRFYRADPSRSRDGGGSGLGLAICSEIARAHGGRVWVDSAEGRGSAFSIALPRRREAGEGTSAGLERGEDLPVSPAAYLDR
jgi:heavy metal sensor kinase